VLYSAIIYVLDFDLLAPPYDQVNQVTVSEMNELNAKSRSAPASDWASVSRPMWTRS
jgi:hypothetical protein